MTKRKAKDLQATIETELVEMFDSDSTPDEGRMKLVTLGIKYLAVKNKLEENEFGSFFNDDAGGAEKPSRQESAARRRANGSGGGASAELGGPGEA